MVGRGFQFGFKEPNCPPRMSHSHIFFLALVLTSYSLFCQVQAAAVPCKAVNLSEYQHCGIYPDGVHNLDCFGKHRVRGLLTCLWKPGNHTSEKTYTLFVRQPAKNSCKAHINSSNTSQGITIHDKHNMTAEVFENSESPHCTKAVFTGSPSSLFRCGPPHNVSFRRQSGRLAVKVEWKQEDMKDVENYTVWYRALGSLLSSKCPVLGQACTVEDLEPSLPYTVRVQCAKSPRCSQCVSSDAFTVPPELTEKPVLVSIAETAAGKGRWTLFLTWKFSPSELLDVYEVTVEKASGEAPREHFTTAQAHIRLTLSYSGFHMSIRAVNRASASPALSHVIARREEEPGMTGKLNVTVHSSKSFTVYWGDSLVQTYVCYSVEWMKEGHKAAHMSFYENTHDHYTLSQLTDALEPYKRYNITLHTRPDKETCNMKAINNSESTYGSTQFYFMEGSPVSAPTNISSYNVALDSMVLQWSSIPEDDIRGFLLGYIIYYTEFRQVTKTEKNISVDPRLNTYKLGDLKSGTVYEIQISGFTKSGEGVRSKTSLFTTNQLQGYSKVTGVIIALAVMTCVLFFGSLIIKRAKTFLWPSIPNPKKSNALQKIERPYELKLLESIYTMKVEEWDTDSLNIVEKEEMITSSTSPSVLPLLYNVEKRTCDHIRRDLEDADGDILPYIRAETLTDVQQTDVHISPLVPAGGYTTMEMLQQMMPQAAPANASDTQESQPEETDLTAAKSGIEYVGQFSTGSNTDIKDTVL